MNAVWRTDIGKIRSSNQDSLLVLKDSYPLYVVADGMGGHRGGDVASAIAVKCLKEKLSLETPGEALLREAFAHANSSIYRFQLNHEEVSGMGTTLTALWEDKEEMLIAHVGDSRAYRLRNGELQQITNDHSLVAEMLKRGELTRESAASYPYRNLITRCVGTDHHVECDFSRSDKQAGDRWLLCSDGLTEYVSDEEIEALLVQPIDQAADCFLALALDRGGKDNITLIIMEVDK